MQTWQYNKTLGISNSKELGNTNTHHTITDLIVTDFVDWDTVTAETTFLEPAVGGGSFYFSILDNLLQLGFELQHAVENMIFSYDVDQKALNILKEKLYTKYQYTQGKENVICEDFLLSGDTRLYDYIITNPPYVSTKNIKPANMSKEEFIKAFKKINQLEDMDNKSDLYMMFYLKTLNLLKPNGTQIFLCSDSWLDCGYGDILKDKIKNEYSLTYMVNSVLYPFFRDDTNAIVTVIKKGEYETSLLTLEKSPTQLDTLKNNPNKVTFPKKEFTKLLNNTLPLNKRNILVIHGDKYHSNKDLLSPYQQYFCKLSNHIQVKNSSVSQNTLFTTNKLVKNEPGSLLPLFWQIQARVGKDPNYKNYIPAETLAYAVDESLLNKKEKELIRTQQCAYMSTIIDRFPLLFFTDKSSFHVSKYIALESNELSPLEICLSLNNVFSFYDMELDLKEGTRKTLRKGECGLTKEIKKKDLENISIINFLTFSKETREAINLLGQDYQHIVLYNIEKALENETYKKIQDLIRQEINMSKEEYETLTQKLLHMYYFRMRNLSKLGVK